MCCRQPCCVASARLLRFICHIQLQCGGEAYPAGFINHLYSCKLGEARKVWDLYKPPQQRWYKLQFLQLLLNQLKGKKNPIRAFKTKTTSGTRSSWAENFWRLGECGREAFMSGPHFYVLRGAFSAGRYWRWEGGSYLLWLGVSILVLMDGQINSSREENKHCLQSQNHRRINAEISMKSCWSVLGNLSRNQNWLLKESKWFSPAWKS